MNRKKVIWLTVGIAFFINLNFPCFIFAETIMLKSGKRIEAGILERTDNYIKVDMYGTAVTYFFDEIATIDGRDIAPTMGTPTLVDENKPIENTNQAYIYFTQGEEWLRKNDYSQAITFYQKAIQVDPSYAKAYAYIGLAYYFLHQNTQAKEYFQKAKELSKSKADKEDIGFVDRYLSVIEEQPYNDNKGFLENKSSITKLILFLYQRPLFFIALEILLDILLILVIAYIFRISQMEIPLPVTVVVAVQFMRGVWSFLMIPFINDIMAPTVVREGISTFWIIISVITAIWDIFLAIALMQLLRWARIAALWFMGIGALLETLRYANNPHFYSYIVWMVTLFFIYYSCLRKEYFE
jgi:tetratricopeptide (TPR) repeat protein